MRTLLLLFLFVLVAWTVLLCTGVALVGWRLDKRNRVDPSTTSPAPLHWLFWPSEPAMLHRRLRGAVATAQYARGSQPPHGQQLREELVRQAVVLDHTVVAASRGVRRQRRALLRDIRPQVREVEHLSMRMSAVGGRPTTPGSLIDETPAQALGRIHDRLELLERAEAELVLIERASGLLDDNQLVESRPPLPIPKPSRTDDRPTDDRPATDGPAPQAEQP